MADLFGTYDKRIKLTVSNTNIDAELTWFPVTVFLKDTFNYYTSQYPTAQNDTYVKSTTNLSANYVAHYATDPTKSLTGSYYENSWMAKMDTVTNQRFHIDLGSAKIIKRIYYENAISDGNAPEFGVKNFTFWGSNTAGSFAELTYGTDTGWTQITTAQSTFDIHSSADEADPKYITVTNTTAYRYYALKFADNYESPFIMGVRRIELQTGEQSGVFAEFDDDTDFDRVAFTTSDGSTQLYADCELFDDSESKAIYHVSKTGWAISDTGTTDFYMYYDNTAGHNTTYISKSGGTAAQSVWDTNFKAVYHMADGASTSAIYDSTSNNNDGTKSAANQPIEVAGKVGKAQSFDGTDDYIDVADSTDFSFGNGTTNTAHTINVISKITNVTTTTQALISKDDYSSKREWVFGIYTASKLKGFIKGDLDGSTQFGRETDAVLANATYKSYAMRFDGVGSPLGIDLLINGVVSDTTDSGTDTEQTAENGASPLRIGSTADDDRYLAGEVAEVRISSTNRSNAWLKATYNSLYDTLLTYGAEEEGAAVNAIFFGCNF